MTPIAAHHLRNGAPRPSLALPLMIAAHPALTLDRLAMVTALV